MNDKTSNKTSTKNYDIIGKKAKPTPVDVNGYQSGGED